MTNMNTNKLPVTVLSGFLGAGKTTSTNLMFYSNTPNNDNINVDFSPQYSGTYVLDNINELFDNKIITNEGFHNKSFSVSTELDADPQGSSHLLIDFNDLNTNKTLINEKNHYYKLLIDLIKKDCSCYVLR